MSERDPIELEAVLRVSADQLSGAIRPLGGKWIPFSGWLGLIGAVESAGLSPGAEADDNPGQSQMA